LHFFKTLFFIWYTVLDCKPWLIKAAYIFYLFTLLKGIDDTQSFLDYVLSTKLTFCILLCSASPAHTSQEEVWWTEGSYSGVGIITKVANYTRNVLVYMWKYIRGLGNLCSSMAYNQGWLNINFL